MSFLLLDSEVLTPLNPTQNEDPVWGFRVKGSLLGVLGRLLYTKLAVQVWAFGLKHLVTEVFLPLCKACGLQFKGLSLENLKEKSAASGMLPKRAKREGSLGHVLEHSLIMFPRKTKDLSPTY